MNIQSLESLPFAQRSMSSESFLLRKLNEQYVEAFMTSDVGWYDDHLAEEFVCIESDGSVLRKAAFLRQTAKGPDVVSYELGDVDVTFLGQDRDVALVRATGTWLTADGVSGTSRYVDVYALQNDEWKTVSAQVTRSAV